MTDNCNKLLDKRLVSPEFYRNPYPVYRQLREEDPVHFSNAWGCWVLTRYEDVVNALRDYRQFTAVGRNTSFLDQLPASVRTEIDSLYTNFTVGMPNTDPPEHTRVRGLVNKAFTMRVVDDMSPRVQAVVDRLLDTIDGAGQMDVIGDFAYPLPAIVIAETLGVPATDRDQFKRWTDDIVAFMGTGLADVDTVRRSNQALLETKQWLLRFIAQRRHSPQDDLLSSLVAAEQRGDLRDETELVATCITLLIGGHETTTGLIGNGLLALWRHPNELQRLKDDPGLITSAVEEFLRYDTSFQRAWRRTAVDVQIGGKKIPKGQPVSLMLGAANRDPTKFPDPDRLDIRRKPNAHTSFGAGVHFCAGAPLGRREASIAFNTLLRRFPDLQIEEADHEWQQSNTFHMLKTLPVRIR